jgi:Ca2+-binding EF-hand superfamily protein
MHIKSFRAKYLTQDDFRHLMRNLPVPVADDDIDQMFDYADTDKDGRLSYKEFQVSLIYDDKINLIMTSKNCTLLLLLLL